MTETGQVRGSAGGSDALRRPVDLQLLAEVLDALRPVGPQRAVGGGGHRDVLQPAHRRHEPRHLRWCVDGFDRRKAAGLVVGFGHFQAASRSSVVVTVASSEIVLSMIAVA